MRSCALLLVLALAACEKPEVPKPKRPSLREQSAERLARGPEIIATYNLSTDQTIQIVRLPNGDPLMGALPSSDITCYIYRDSRSSQMTCPAQVDVVSIPH